jgi:deoxyribonuclease V
VTGEGTGLASPSEGWGRSLGYRWPEEAETLAQEQTRLALLPPEPWQPPDGGLLVAAAFVAFVRGEQGPGHPGDRAWVGAVLMQEAPLAPSSTASGSADFSPRLVGSAVDAEAGGRALGSTPLRLVAERVVPGVAGASYGPGLLALREGPMLADAILALPRRPDVLLVDATGRDHPRRAGLALQLGAALDVPTVGVTHRTLRAVGDDAGPTPGDQASLRLDGDEVARWVRTAPGVRSVVAHAAWRTDPATAAGVVLRCAQGRRTPEPLRQARRVAREARERAAAAG